MHILTANISEMVTDNANIIIVYSVDQKSRLYSFLTLNIVETECDRTNSNET